MSIEHYNLKQVNSALSAIDRSQYSENHEKLESRKAELEQKLSDLDVQFRTITGHSINESATLESFSRDIVRMIIFNFLGIAPFFIFVVVAALLGFNTISWNNVHLHGIGAIPAGTLVYIIFSALFSIISAIGVTLSYLFKKQNLHSDK